MAASASSPQICPPCSVNGFGAPNMATAAEYALMLTAAGPQPPAATAGPGLLSARERELVTMVAQGHTNAQIAAQ